MSVASSASTSWKLLGSGFDGLPLVVFEECSDATVAGWLPWFRSDTAVLRRQSRVVLSFEL
jgi:hypothetical protein